MNEIKEKIRNSSVVAKAEGDSQLGSIFWYSVSSEVQVTRDELKETFNNIDIDENWLPNEIRPSDAFRRSTREVQRKNIPTSDPTKFRNYLVREVYSDNQIIQRNVVIETVDQTGKRLAYEPNASVLTLDKENNSFNVLANDGYSQELGSEAKNKYQKYITYYSSQQLRIMVSKYLGSLAPTSVRPNGGVYFVPQSFAPDLKKLQLLCEALQSEGVSIPLYDTADNKNLVLTRLENELKEALVRCQELEETDNLKKAIYKDSIEEARRIALTYQEYKKSLSIDVDKLENTLNDLRMSAVKITRKITKSK